MILNLILLLISRLSATSIPIVWNVATFAGSGSAGCINSTALASTFWNPNGIAFDAANNLYVCDSSNNAIRLVNISTMTVVTYAGQTNPGSLMGSGSAIAFNYPVGILVDSSNNIIMTDQKNNQLKRLTNPGATAGPYSGAIAFGSTTGTGTAGKLHYPAGICMDLAGNTFTADTLNNQIRNTTLLHYTSLLAGSTTAGSADGLGALASFNNPRAITTDLKGNFYVSDSGLVVLI